MRFARALTLLGSVLWTGHALCAAVEVDGDLLLGVWSQQRTRFIANVPACVYTDDGASAGGYRVSVSGGVAADRFAMSNGVGDTIPFRVRWYGSRSLSPREELSPGALSRRVYRFGDRARCAAGDGPGLEAQARTRDVARAAPGVYRDTLTVLISPI